MSLRDRQMRAISYVRLSLTDRCNYRCSYCAVGDSDDVETHAGAADLLTADELARLVGILQTLGVRRIRLTGGEPTVRRDLVEIVARLARLGLDDLSLTTNGERLAELAAPLFDAGLHRLNVSVDTLDPERFSRLTGRGRLSRVMAGIDAARRAGFPPIKINTVVLGDENDAEVGALAAWSWERDLVPRFIEMMPLSVGQPFRRARFVAAAEVLAQLTATHGPLQPTSDGPDGGGPARYHRVTGGRFMGRIVGVIAAVTQPFCATCNRVRVTATGQLHACLGSDDAVELAAALRAGSDGDVAALVLAAVAHKVDGHRFTTLGEGGPRKHMLVIGG